MNPCLPIHHTAATLHAWSVWRHAHLGWVAKAAAPVCIRAAALALPLVLPNAAFVPGRPGSLAPIGPGYHGRPVLSGPAYEIGAVFASGVFEVPALAALPVQVGQTYPYASGLQPLGGNAAVDESSTLFPQHSPGLTKIQPAPPIDVPEPVSALLLAGALVSLFCFNKVWRQ